MKLKVDTGADICAVNTDDLQDFPFPVVIKEDNSLLEGYGPGTIKNIGATSLKVAFRDRSINTKFNFVYVPIKPSVIRCAQAQNLGIITVNIDDIESKAGADVNNSTDELQSKAGAEVNKSADHIQFQAGADMNKSADHIQTKAGANVNNPAKVAAAQGKLTKELILKEYKDCFDKIGRFPGEKYHIKLIDNPLPVVHPPRTVLVHILLIYKAELDKMLAEDIIVPVTEPTEWVNSIVCHVTEKPDGTKKVKVCLDPKDMNKNICREHYYSKTIDEILPLLHGAKKVSASDTNKGYFHVEMDYESSLLCTFNTPSGRFRPKRLPFEVKIAQDVFQCRLDEIFQDIPNVARIADDILVCGSSDIEHDLSFINMLEACRVNNVALNSGKLQFKQEKINFYGILFQRKDYSLLKTSFKQSRTLKFQKIQLSYLLFWA